MAVTNRWTPTYIDSFGEKYSVTFGTKNTWTNWRLVPDSRPVIALPEQKKQTIDIPGGNGVIDLSMAVNKYPLFNRRSGSLSFTLSPDVDAETVRQDMAYNLHGRKLDMTLSDDPDFYYTGYFSVNWESNTDGSSPTVEIEYDLEPYKTAHEITYIKSWFQSTYANQNSSTNSFTVNKYVSSSSNPYPQFTKYENTIPETFPTPLIITVTGISNSAKCDVLFGNTFLEIPFPGTNETSGGLPKSHFLLTANKTYTIGQYLISSSKSSTNYIKMYIDNSRFMLSTGNNSSMTLAIGYRRKLL